MKILFFALIIIMFFSPITSSPYYDEDRWSEECGCENITGPPLLISDIAPDYVKIYNERNFDSHSKKTLEIIYELLSIQLKIAVRDGFV